jgi:uncharacterized membrane protein
VTDASISFNKDEQGADAGRLHALNAVLFVGMWGLTAWLYTSLPERIPGHIGPSGVTRWEPREGGMWFLLPILGTFQLFLMYVLASSAGGSAQGINIPRKQRLLALPREGQRYAMRPFRSFMYGMAAWLMVLTIYIQVSFYRIAVQATTGEPATGHLLVGILFLTAIPILLAFRLSRSIHRRIDEWEAANSAR